MKRYRIVLVITIAVLVILSGIACSVYWFENYRVHKIDFVKFSAEEEPGSPFTADMAEWYLKAMGLKPVRNGKEITVEYKGLFFEKKWKIIPKNNSQPSTPANPESVRGR